MPSGSSVTDHWLGSYLDAAIAVVQAQFTARRFEDGTQVPNVRLVSPVNGYRWLHPPHFPVHDMCMLPMVSLITQNTGYCSQYCWSRMQLTWLGSVLQGALDLLALEDVRQLLEDGGLDWASLRAVATGTVEAGAEV